MYIKYNEVINIWQFYFVYIGEALRIVEEESNLIKVYEFGIIMDEFLKFIFEQ